MLSVLKVFTHVNDQCTYVCKCVHYCHILNKYHLAEMFFMTVTLFIRAMVNVHQATELCHITYCGSLITQTGRRDHISPVLKAT